MEIEKVGDTKSLLYVGKASSSDVDWNQGELPIALPEGLSDGASIVRMKDGQVGIIQRGSHGLHNGVLILKSEVLDALKEMIK